MRLRISVFLILFSLLGGAFAQTEGTVIYTEFTGPITHAAVRYAVYLPPEYDQTDKRFPVAYWLHGLGSDEQVAMPRVSRSYELARAAGVVPPLILVSANGFESSWWADSFDGAKPAETNVIHELIPFIDANFRTLPDRRFRMIQGMSMGGFGATAYAAKYPHLFSACVSYDGAIYSWDTFSRYASTYASAIFNNNGDYFDLISPFVQVEQHADSLRGRVAFRLVVGVLTSQNQAFDDHLAKYGIIADYVQTSCEHSLTCLLEEEGLNSWAFLAATLETAAFAQDKTEEQLPTYFGFVNFPNPFNGSTTLVYRLPQSTHVTLDLLAVNGQFIRNLVDEVEAAGRHQRVLSTPALPSGIYLCRLMTSYGTDFRKILLVK